MSWPSFGSCKNSVFVLQFCLMSKIGIHSELCYIFLVETSSQLQGNIFSFQIKYTINNIVSDRCLFKQSSIWHLLINFVNSIMPFDTSKIIIAFQLKVKFLENQTTSCRVIFFNWKTLKFHQFSTSKIQTSHAIKIKFTIINVYKLFLYNLHSTLYSINKNTKHQFWSFFYAAQFYVANMLHKSYWFSYA